MKNREDTLYVKSNEGDDFWLFDLESIKMAHHGYTKDKDGKLLPFVDLPTCGKLSRFYDKDFKFALYRKNSDCYYILSHFKLTTVLASPETASDVLRTIKDTCKPSEWADVPKELAELK